MPRTDTELLEAVRETIFAVLTRGQDVTIDGRRYSRAQLPELRALERDLVARVRRGGRGRIPTRRIVPVE